MEELYNLLAERLSSIQDLEQKFGALIGQFETDPAFTLQPHQLNELSNFINNLKKTEKMRILRENDFLEVIFSLRSFDLPQRVRFQTKSYEVMKKVASEFKYDKYTPSGEVKDLSKLYLKFFQYLQLQAKIEDLKRAYANNKLINFPIISILAKWLTEITRKHYQDVLKEKSGTLFSQISRSSTQTVKKLTSMDLSQKSFRTALSVEPQGNLTERAKESAPLVNFQCKLKEFNPDISRKHFQNIAPAPDSNTNVALKQILSQVESQYEKPKISKVSTEATMKETMKETVKETVKEPVTTKESLPPKQNIEQKPRFGFSRAKAHQDSPPAEDPLPRYMTVITPEQYMANYLDIIDDLEYVVSTSLLQSSIKPYTIRKPKSTKVLDFEKKKDLTVQYYKMIYARNQEIERSVNSYKLKLKEKNKLKYDPNQLASRGDAYVETITVVSLVKNLAHAIPEQVKQKYPSIFGSEDKAPTVIENTSQVKFRITTNSSMKERSTTAEKTPQRTQRVTETQRNEVEVSNQYQSIKGEKKQEIQKQTSRESCVENVFGGQNKEFSGEELRLERFQSYETYDSRKGSQQRQRAKSPLLNARNGENVRPKSKDLSEGLEGTVTASLEKKSSFMQARIAKMKEYLPHVEGEGLGERNSVLQSTGPSVVKDEFQGSFYTTRDYRENRQAQTSREKELSPFDRPRELGPTRRLRADSSKNSTASGIERPKYGQPTGRMSPSKINKDVNRNPLIQYRQQSPLVKKTIIATSSIY